MNYHMFLDAVADANPASDGSVSDYYSGDQIYVLDADGFIHDIQYVTWDPDDRCFYITTKFTPEEFKSDH